MILKLNDHAVVCGLGNFSRALMEQLLRQHIPVVLVCDDADAVNAFSIRYPDVPVLNKSPMCELALAHANLLTARVVVAATDCDVNNLLIAMSCKEIRPDIQVIALAQEETSAGRMEKIGVDQIVCPSLLGGQYAARLITGNESGPNPVDCEPQFPIAGPAPL